MYESRETTYPLYLKQGLYINMTICVLHVYLSVPSPSLCAHTHRLMDNLLIHLAYPLNLTLTNAIQLSERKLYEEFLCVF